LNSILTRLGGFNESLYIDYRDFIQQNRIPRFEFGFGLTYTTFTYSLLITGLSSTNLSLLPPAAAISEGGQASLFEVIATIRCTIQNTGSVAAAEVAQLYVGIPNAPEKQLRGFAKKLLQPGESAAAKFELTRRDLSIWDVVQQQWVLQRGAYQIYVGASVLDIRLIDKLQI